MLLQELPCIAYDLRARHCANSSKCSGYLPAALSSVLCMRVIHSLTSGGLFHLAFQNPDLQKILSFTVKLISSTSYSAVNILYTICRKSVYKGFCKKIPFESTET